MIKLFLKNKIIIATLVATIFGNISAYGAVNVMERVENDIIYPSMLSNKYLELVGKDIQNGESPFKVYGVENLNVSLNSKFIKDIQSFSEKYINTLKEDKPNFDFNDYIIERDKDIYNNIALDLSENEFLYFIEKSNFEILEKSEGFLTADCNAASLRVVFKFTVDKILNPEKQVTSVLEEGETYIQEREIHFKRTQDGSYKIYEQFISAPILQ